MFALVLVPLILTLVFPLLFCFVAWGLARNNPQREQQLFERVLSLIDRGPRMTEIALRALDVFARSRHRRHRHELTSAGSPAIPDNSRDRAE